MPDPHFDPRDEIGEAANALAGLYLLLAIATPGECVPADKLGPLVGLVEEKLRPAADAVQRWTRPGWQPPAE